MVEKYYKISEIWIADILYNNCINNGSEKLAISSQLYRQIYHITPGQMIDIFQNKYISKIPIIYSKIDNANIEFIPISHYLENKELNLKYISYKRLEQIYIELNIKEIRNQNIKPAILSQEDTQNKIVDINTYRTKVKRKKD